MCGLESNAKEPGIENRWPMVCQAAVDAHINCLELLAVFLTIAVFAKEKKAINIVVEIDNISARACTNHLGGTYSWPMNALAVKT